MKNVLRKQSTLLLCLILAASARATTYYSKAAGSAAAEPVLSSVTWCLDANLTQVADPQPVLSNGDGNEYVFLGAEKWSADTVPGKCYLGCDGVTVGSVAKGFDAYANRGIYTFSDLTLVDGQIQMNDKYSFALNGNITLPAGRSFRLRSFNNLIEGEDRCFTIGASATFTSAADSKLVFETHFADNASSESTLVPTFEVAGNMSGFKGVYSVPDVPKTGANIYARIRMTSASAFGDTTAVTNGALRMGQNAYLEVGASVVQSVNRGIAMILPASGRAGVMAASGTSWTLTSPVSGTTGTFVKRGAGTVTFDGPIEMPNIEIMEGKAIFGANATYAANPRILVRAGASVSFEKFVSGATVTYEDGVPVEPLVVAYDASSKVTTPIAYTAAQAADARSCMGGRISLSLSNTISMPDGEARRLALMTIDGGSFTAEDFMNATPATDWGLPRTSIEVETDGSGVQTVFLVTRPTFSYTGSSSNKSIDQSANWNPSGAPTASGDYYMNVTGNGIARTGSGAYIDSFSFAGGSLSLTKVNAEIYDYAQDFAFTELRLFAGTKVSSLQTAGYGCRLIGKVYVDSSSTGNSKAVIQMPGTTDSEMRTTLTGSGDLQLRTSPGTYPLKMTGVSPEFVGGLFFDHPNPGGRTVAATNGLAFGGALAQFRADAVSFVPSGDLKYTLLAEESLTINAENRGWTVKNMTFAAEEEKTLVFKPAKLTVTGSLAKKGAGTLVLGCPIEGGTTLSVEEGVLEAADSTCTAGLSVTFAAGATLRAVAGPAGAPQGLAAETLAPASGETKICVSVVPPAGAVAAKRKFTVPICSVPSEHADLTYVFSVDHFTGYGSSIVSKTVDGRTVYYAAYTLSGLTVVIR